MKAMSDYQLTHGARLMLPVGFVPRAVIDVMGTPTLYAEVQIVPGVKIVERPYTVLNVCTTSVVSAGAVYLGSSVESHGAAVTHWFVEPA